LRRTRDAEIKYFDHVVVGNERVAGFEVRMHDALRMGIAQGLAQRAQDFDHSSLRKTSCAIDFEHLIEREPVKQLHHHEDIAAVARKVVDRDDIGVCEFQRLLGFARE
jgi:hypothetical protein